jgi:two-component system response regulator RegX3
MTRILIVEDEVSFSDPLSYLLSKEGYEVSVAENGNDALTEFDATGADLVLLDLMLPGLSGVDVCRALRQRSNVPVIMLTAKDSEIDKVVGLELGADDYVVKPFGFRELLARIRAVMRRVRPEDGDDVLRAGRLEMDVRARRASVAEVELELTPKEFDLLALLVGDSGAVVTRERILREVWETDWFGSSKTIDVHVASLRRKLGDARWIETVRGVGLRLAPQP